MGYSRIVEDGIMTANEYKRIHATVARLFGKASAHWCEMCSIPAFCDVRASDWAIIHGSSYQMIRSHWMAVCRSCHRKYDTKSDDQHHNFGRKHSDEMRAKVSTAVRGRKLTEETKAKMSTAVSGSKNPFFGRRHSEETRAKMRESQRRRFDSK